MCFFSSLPPNFAIDRFKPATDILLTFDIIKTGADALQTRNEYNPRPKRTISPSSSRPHTLVLDCSVVKKFACTAFSLTYVPEEDFGLFTVPSRIKIPDCFPCTLLYETLTVACCRETCASASRTQLHFEACLPKTWIPSRKCKTMPSFLRTSAPVASSLVTCLKTHMGSLRLRLDGVATLCCTVWLLLFSNLKGSKGSCSV